MKHQSGFTLVEIAIVLVIIGLLLGGVLKGQELIESARVKNLAQDFRAISVAVLSYQDRFRALPGDDQGAQTRWPAAGGGNAVCQAAGPANGLINGQWNSTVANSEPLCVWEHLRRANLLTGAGGAAPTHADAGVFGVTSEAAQAAVTGIQGSLLVCAENVRGRHVVPLDAMLDDGNPSTGSMQARAAAANDNGAPGQPVAAGAAIAEGAPFFVCMGF